MEFSTSKPAVEATHAFRKDDRGKSRRYVAVGTGQRVRMYLDPIARRFRQDAELVGLCDISQTRMEFHLRRLSEDFNHPPVPLYPVEKFSDMLRETRPDTVIVCSLDNTHHAYIVEALQAGCDVITEKPITTDAEKCGVICDAVDRTGGNVRVAFNCRWMPGATEVKKLLQHDSIGPVRAMHLEYLLNTSHGADYFRRWHSEKAISGGLLVHKSTHHFDLVNWWIDSIPETVYAMGDLAFYGRANATARGDESLTRNPRYTGHDGTNDPFAFQLDDPSIPEPGIIRGLYLEAEKETGYLRDRNVFRDGIDIEDTLHVLVRYRNRAVLNYSLQAFSPYEGFSVAFTGDRGRIEYRQFYAYHHPKNGSSPMSAPPHAELRVHPLFGQSYEVSIPELEGEHGGADELLQEQLFSANPPRDVLGRFAGHEQGIASALIGIAGNQSIATGEPVRIQDLLTLRPQAVKLSELV